MLPGGRGRSGKRSSSLQYDGGFYPRDLSKNAGLLAVIERVDRRIVGPPIALRELRQPKVILNIA